MDQTPSTYYQYITDLPLRRFIDVQVDNNLHALTITGNPTQEQLQEAWYKIQLQYSDAIGDNELKVYWKLVADVQLCYQNISFVNKTAPMLLDLLESLYDDNGGLDESDYSSIMEYIALAGAELNAITSSTFPFNPQHYDQFQADIKRAISKAKALTIQYQLLKSQLEAMKAKSENGEKPTREYYIGLVMTLSDAAGYKLTIDSETVYEFCERIRRHNKTKGNEWQPKKT